MAIAGNCLAHRHDSVYLLLVRSSFPVIDKSLSPLGQAVSALVLLLIAIVCGWSSVAVLVKAEQVKQWEVVPAQVVFAELLSERDPRRSGQESTLYETRATYHYAFRDQVYTGETVSLYSGTLGPRSFNMTTYSILGAAYSAETTVPCHVNPDRPDESILFVEPYPYEGLDMRFFAVLAGCVGLTMLTKAWTEFAHRRQPNKHSSHGEPAPVGIVSTNEPPNLAMPLAVSTIPVTLYLASVLWLQQEVLEIARISIWFQSPWLVPIAMLVVSAYHWFYWRLRSINSLEVHPNPLVAGTTMVATFRCARKLKRKATVQLRCVHMLVTGSIANMRVYSLEQWRSTQVAVFHPSSTRRSQSEITMVFDIPTSAVVENAAPDTHQWHLTIAWKSFGIARSVSFAWTNGVPF